MITCHAEHFGTLHFIGIGGIGMSGIAEALHVLGYTVQGSDQADSYNTKRLQKHGIPVLIGHNANHITDTIAAVVISSAIKPGNPELLEARRMKLPIVRRADMLAELMRHRKCISVSGTHGKTTTTSLIGAMLEQGDSDPTIINGGIIHAYGTNTRMGQGEWMVVESDESDGTFTRLPTTIAVVTNIDPEHMDHYGSFDAVRDAYRTFIENIPFYGMGVLCADHTEVAALIPSITDRRIFTYGLSDNVDTRAINVKTTPDGATFDVTFSHRLTGGDPETVTDFFLPMMGVHNIQNALSAITIARAFDYTPDTMRAALKNFQGVKRRFTKIGVANGITVIDDYGHHPVEIRAVLSAARQATSTTGGNVIAVVQPHRYSRLASLFPEFCTCFTDADHVIVADVYAAGEDPIDGINGETLGIGIARHASENKITPHTVTAMSDPTHLADIVARIAKPNDFVICLGAGSITTWAHSLPDELDLVFATKKSANGA